MAPNTSQHRRTHNLLLISNLLNQTTSSSPFTLVLDCLEQTGLPVLAESLARANRAKTISIFVSFETLQKPRNVDVFIPAWRQELQSWQRELAQHTKEAHGLSKRTLIVIDTLNPLSATSGPNLPGILSSLLSTPTTSVVAIYHTDIPEPASQTNTSTIQNPYAPSQQTLLTYLATTVISTHSLQHVIARKAARDRSVAEPSFGLHSGVEGALQDLGANGPALVLEMEHRRKSGRGVREWFVLARPSASKADGARGGKADGTESGAGDGKGNGRGIGSVSLLEDHADYRGERDGGELGGAASDGTGVESTFELGLTEKQRRDREAVVLPYFDAQVGKEGGGKILYDMGEEDDFDEEEDVL